MGATTATQEARDATFYERQRARAARMRRTPNGRKPKPLPDVPDLAILDEPDPPGLDAILAAWEAAHDADRR